MKLKKTLFSDSISEDFQRDLKLYIKQRLKRYTTDVATCKLIILWLKNSLRFALRPRAKYNFKTAQSMKNTEMA